MLSSHFCQLESQIICILLKVLLVRYVLTAVSQNLVIEMRKKRKDFLPDFLKYE